MHRNEGSLRGKFVKSKAPRLESNDIVVITWTDFHGNRASQEYPLEDEQTTGEEIRPI